MATRPFKKILHIITRLDLGGSADNTLLTVIGQLRAGYDVDIIAGHSEYPPSVNEETAKKLGATITRYNCIKRAISPWHDFISIFVMFWVILTKKYDIVHTHTSKVGISGRIAAKLAGARRIVHTPHGHIFYGYFSPRVTAFFVSLERFCMYFTHAQITLTQRNKEDYLARNIGREDNLFPIFSGISLEPYLEVKTDRTALRQELGYTPEHFVVGTVARLVNIKNHHLTIEAAKLIYKDLPNVRFLFIGDGDLREKHIKNVNEAGMAHIFNFAGWYNNINEMLTTFDIFVMCSINEGMGRAFVEAQAVGLPVIGSNVGGIPEVLQDGRTGFLVSNDNPQALADKIKVLYNNRELVEKMGKAAREWVYPTFTKEMMVKKIIELYEKIW